MSNRLTDEELTGMDAFFETGAEGIVDYTMLHSAVRELRTARAQLAMMGPVYEAAELDREELVSLKHFYGNYPNGDRRFCVFCVKAKAVLERICDANDRSALSTPTDAKEDGDGE